ncbi:hypothetical protein [Streptomyces sp. NRRL S-813]|uniref:hypothetical protein n=1 Tax=Streptomyces sp. NRRL S-813 TaxID=1463919 RepID=UPI0004C091A6|nr:hypothetical protein [Streptomyces sp. NRRL S-813]
MRQERWPTLESVVALAVEQHLAEPDLAGPWPKLTANEEQRLARAGRWPGTSLGIPMVQRNYKLPNSLVTRLRTTAWRMSEEPLNLLHKRGLVDTSPHLDDDERALRNELAAQLYPVPRIVREALTRYGPTTSNEPQKASELSAYA